MSETRKIKGSSRQGFNPLIEDMNFVFNNLLLPVVIIDKNANILRFNNPWAEMFGFGNPDQYLFTSYFEFLNLLRKKDIYSTSIKNKMVKIIEKMMKGNFKSQFLEFPIRDNWFLIHVHPVLLNDQLEGVIISHNDITQWKQKELFLTQENKKAFENSQRKMFFLANLNHELKNPLNSIIGFSELLKEKIAENQHSHLYSIILDNLMDASSHLSSIVFRILNMAKIESGTLTLNEERIAPNKLVQLSLNIIRPMFPKRQIQVDICPKAVKGTLKCDKNLAMEVLINLLMNSLKFSQGDIKLFCLSDEKGNLVFNVEDRGLGMNQEEIQVALEPFGQNLRSPDDKNTGLGLGVPFSNQVMKLHGGWLQIQSEKGKGTKVGAIFPADRVEIR